MMKREATAGRRPRALVIGLDGASFEVLNPLMEAGRLPHLARLMRDGASGELLSTIPYSTAPAWASFMTGKNPGKHGIFHFGRMLPEQRCLGLIDGRHVRSEKLWGALNRAGRPAIVLNIPITYPPEEIQGIMVSGIFVPRSAEESMIYPREHFSELDQLLGGCKLDLYYTPAWAEQDFEGILREATRTAEGLTRAGLHFISTQDWDLCVVVFTEMDRLQHWFWKWLFPEEAVPGSAGGGELRERHERLLDFYTHLDAQLGKLIAQAGEEAYVFVLSDHGFGGGRVRRRFYINAWLASLGLFSPQENPSGSLPRYLARKLQRKGSAPGEGEVSEEAGQKVPQLDASLEMDWERTRVCYVGVESMGLYILREPCGPVKAEEYEPLRDRLQRELLALTDSATGQKVIEKVFKREELYWGAYVPEAPDLLFTLPGNQYTLSKRWKKGPLFRDTREKVEGFHRPEGVWMARGPGIQANLRLAGAQIPDIAPTLLYALGAEVPREMDGKVLLEAFAEGYRSDHPVRYAESPGEAGATGGTEEMVYSAEELETIQKRLADLGYL
ncbi:MAG: alkaline phosphatase family protein [Candidatus Tectomicrobia bacterium]|uniref:Alkaline phosphatase family protein n=1 Tax=Tectimicrobiota bacterium TaxID=2528274 RepID=A0A932CQQ5_UNCTE|nr:alkaline phosphatase family protein [Candidatus Tectomicrobia bacterium]